MNLNRKIAMQFKKPNGFFGRIISSLMIKGNKSAYENLLNYLNLQQNDKILEIGYGPGIGIKMIAERYDSCEIHGIDFSELMYIEASKRNEKYINKNRVCLKFGDFIDLQPDSIAFDKIFCINVVYFWNNLNLPFSKVKMLLKQDGIFCIFMAKADDLTKLKFPKEDIFNKHLIEQVIDTLKSLNFRDIDHYFDKGYYIKARK